VPGFHKEGARHWLDTVPADVSDDDMAGAFNCQFSTSCGITAPKYGQLSTTCGTTDSNTDDRTMAVRERTGCAGGLQRPSDQHTSKGGLAGM
jgi:hypothetical protein